MRFVLALLVLGSVACHPLSDDYDDAQMRCGVAGQTVPRGAMLLHIGPAGMQVDGADLAAYVDEGTKTMPLDVTPKGCVVVPKGTQASVSVYSLSRPLALRLEAAGAEHEPRDLEPLDEPLTGGLVCEAAANAVFQPHALSFSLSQTATATARDWQVRATTIELTPAEGTREALSLTTAGLPALDLTRTPDLATLPDGVYTVRITLENLRKRRFAAGSCDLRVHRTAPIVTGLTMPLVVGSDDVIRLPRLPDGTQVQLCYSRPGAPDCDALSAYAPASSLTKPPGPGAWSVRAYAVDADGNRSGVVQHDTFVDAAPPRLAAAWTSPELQTHPAIVRALGTTLRAHVTLDDDAVGAESHVATALGDNLECRVDFRAPDGALSQQPLASCAAGRCRGKLLDDWTACDEDVAFTLANEASLFDQLVVLHVRTRNTVGGVAEASATAWFAKDAVQPWRSVDALWQELDGKTLAVLTGDDDVPYFVGVRPAVVFTGVPQDPFRGQTIAFATATESLVGCPGVVTWAATGRTRLVCLSQFLGAGGSDWRWIVIDPTTGFVEPLPDLPGGAPTGLSWSASVLTAGGRVFATPPTHTPSVYTFDGRTWTQIASFANAASATLIDARATGGSLTVDVDVKAGATDTPWRLRVNRAAEVTATVTALPPVPAGDQIVSVLPDGSVWAKETVNPYLQPVVHLYNQDPAALNGLDLSRDPNKGAPIYVDQTSHVWIVGAGSGPHIFDIVDGAFRNLSQIYGWESRVSPMPGYNGVATTSTGAPFVLNDGLVYQAVDPTWIRLGSLGGKTPGTSDQVASWGTTLRTPEGKLLQIVQLRGEQVVIRRLDDDGWTSWKLGAPPVMDGVIAPDRKHAYLVGGADLFVVDLTTMSVVRSSKLPVPIDLVRTSMGKAGPILRAPGGTGPHTMYYDATADRWQVNDLAIPDAAWTTAPTCRQGTADAGVPMPAYPPGAQIRMDYVVDCGIWHGKPLVLTFNSLTQALTLYSHTETGWEELPSVLQPPRPLGIESAGQFPQDNVIFNFFVSSDERLWISYDIDAAHGHAGILHFDGKAWHKHDAFSERPVFQTNGSLDYFRGFIEDLQGQVWTYTARGQLYLFDEHPAHL